MYQKHNDDKVPVAINVAHVFLTLDIGGMEKISLDIIQRMDRERFRHHIICLSKIGVLGKAFADENISITLIEKKSGFDFSIITRLKQFFKENNIHIVHSNNPAPHFWAGYAAKLAGVPVRLNTKHGKNFIWMKRRALLNRISALTSHKIVCVSEGGADLTRRVEKVPAEKICVISNGVDTAQFLAGLKPSEELLQGLDLNREVKVIGSVARFSKDKDHDSLIKAFACLQPENPEAVLLLVGDGETIDAQKTLAKKLGVERSVLFLGARRDIVDLISLMDIYVLSSHTEGMPISLLEAMSCGKVCVASEVGGCPEIIDHGDNGYLVPASRPEILAECLSSCLSRLGEEKELQARARLTVMDRYSLNATIQAYETLYSELLSR